MFAEINKSWKGFIIQKSLLGISAHVRKKIHFSKIRRICKRIKSKNNGAQNTIQNAVNLGVPADVRKKKSTSLLRICVCANNPALEDC